MVTTVLACSSWCECMQKEGWKETGGIVIMDDWKRLSVQLFDVMLTLSVVGEEPYVPSTCQCDSSVYSTFPRSASWALQSWGVHCVHFVSCSLLFCFLLLRENFRSILFVFQSQNKSLVHFLSTLFLLKSDQVMLGSLIEQVTIWKGRTDLGAVLTDGSLQL